MSSGHNTKGGSNGHFNHVDPTKVNIYSLLAVSIKILSIFLVFGLEKDTP